MQELKDDVQEAGKITGKARKEIEETIGRKVADKSNYKNLTNQSTKKLGLLKKVNSILYKNLNVCKKVPYFGIFLAYLYGNFIKNIV